MPYRLPPERPSEGPSDAELARIARACGIEPRWVHVSPQAPPPPLSAADDLRLAQERSKRGVGSVALTLLITLTALATLAGIAVIVIGLILALVVPGLVSGVTK